MEQILPPLVYEREKTGSWDTAGFLRFFFRYLIPAQGRDGVEGWQNLIYSCRPEPCTGA